MFFVLNTFVFDIETVPDVVSGRKLHDFQGLDDQEVAQAMYARRRISHQNEFLPLHLQRIVAISVAFRSHTKFKVWSLGEPQSTESDLIQRFFDGIEKYSPTLVSWNGGGFDLPVLHYRALLHGIAAPRYWEGGDNDNNFKWNNYLSRYHNRHTDLMDVLAGYQPRATAPLEDIAVMLGLPGKMGMSGAAVWSEFCLGNIAQIRNYCETDVLNTYLVFLRYELIRGKLSPARYQQECQMVRDALHEENKPHLEEFVQRWHST
jgi:predicted PolB exonuclease-like 3'-5' exonuclease